MNVKPYPKVMSVLPADDVNLIVTFADGVTKVYDCKPLLESPAFARLKEKWLFRTVRADSGGYGVVWDDELDLSEAELWENGRLVEF